MCYRAITSLWQATLQLLDNEISILPDPFEASSGPATIGPTIPVTAIILWSDLDFSGNNKHNRQQWSHGPTDLVKPMVLNRILKAKHFQKYSCIFIFLIG